MFARVFNIAYFFMMISIVYKLTLIPSIFAFIPALALLGVVTLYTPGEMFAVITFVWWTIYKF